MQIRELTPDRYADWDDFVFAHPAGWFWHDSQWLHYCEAYRNGNVNKSFMVLDNERIVGICPLIQQGEAFSAGGDPLPWPLVAEGTDRLEVSWTMIPEQRRICKALPLAFRQSPLAARIEVNETEGWKDISWSSRVLDLTRPLDEIWRGVSKGHAAAIHKGLREMDIREQEDVESLHQLHVREAGRETRPLSTWYLMQQWLIQARGWLYEAIDDDCRLAGAAYFITYKQKAYYASAAYVRDGVAHALVWTAIRQLRQLGITALELGRVDGYAGDFKRGFGGEDRPVVAVEWRR